MREKGSLFSFTQMKKKGGEIFGLITRYKVKDHVNEKNKPDYKSHANGICCKVESC